MRFIPRNVGGLDRKTRLIVGPILLVVGLLGLFEILNTGIIVAVVALVIGGILVATGYAQRCPINATLGVNTLENKAAQ